MIWNDWNQPVTCEFTRNRRSFSDCGTGWWFGQFDTRCCWSWLWNDIRFYRQVDTTAPRIQSAADERHLKNIWIEYEMDSTVVSWQNIQMSCALFGGNIPWRFFRFIIIFMNKSKLAIKRESSYRNLIALSESLNQFRNVYQQSINYIIILLLLLSNIIIIILLLFF